MTNHVRPAYRDHGRLMPKKRRKRTNKDVPAKGRLKDMADSLWSLAVRADWANRCAVCGSGKVEAHHLIPRGHESLRFTVNNGIALCATHHQFCNNLSPHLNAAGWMGWLKEHHRSLWKWCEDNKYPPDFTGTKNPPYYVEQILRLRQYVEPEEAERICGIKFSRWLDEQAIS